MAPKKQGEQRFVLRLSEEMHEQMKLLAERHDRSLNGEIVQALRLYILAGLTKEGRRDR